MNAVETLRRLSLPAAAAWPALASAQPYTAPDGPPGGVASAWPLGLIVVLVAAVFAVGALVARRGRRAPGGGGRP